MRYNPFFHALKFLVLAVVIGSAVGYGTMYLWNWLMPTIFGVAHITVWQALGLFVLGKVLFGGFRGGRCHCGGGRFGKGGPWGRRGREWKEKWEKMSPEERERFRTGMRGGMHGGARMWGRHDWCKPEETPVAPPAQ